MWRMATNTSAIPRKTAKSSSRNWRSDQAMMITVTQTTMKATSASVWNSR